MRSRYVPTRAVRRLPEAIREIAAACGRGDPCPGTPRRAKLCSNFGRGGNSTAAPVPVAPGGCLDRGLIRR